MMTQQKMLQKNGAGQKDISQAVFELIPEFSWETFCEAMILTVQSNHKFAYATTA